MTKVDNDCQGYLRGLARGSVRMMKQTQTNAYIKNTPHLQLKSKLAEITKWTNTHTHTHCHLHSGKCRSYLLDTIEAIALEKEHLQQWPETVVVKSASHRKAVLLGSRDRGGVMADQCKLFWLAVVISGTWRRWGDPCPDGWEEDAALSMQGTDGDWK